MFCLPRVPERHHRWEGACIKEKAPTRVRGRVFLSTWSVTGIMSFYAHVTCALALRCYVMWFQWVLTNWATYSAPQPWPPRYPEQRWPTGPGHWWKPNSHFTFKSLWNGKLLFNVVFLNFSVQIFPEDWHLDEEPHFLLGLCVPTRGWLSP